MYKILLVDDEQNVLNALKRELHDQYEVEGFVDPVMALQRCHEMQFDLVITDYQMPHMNGIEFFKQLEKLQPDAMRFILSGQADTRVLVHAINETHIYRFIDKPWDLTELAAKIAQALAYRKVLLENRQRPKAPAMAVIPGQLVPHNDRRYQILVVDDEPNVLNTISRDLSSRNTFGDLHMVLLQEADPLHPAPQMDLRFDIYATTSPLEALDYTKHTACDVVIVDYLMPEMNGMEFLTEFRKQQPDAVCIMLSGHTDKKILTDAINRVEIFNFISNPWREYELKSAVTQAIIYKNMMLENRLFNKVVN